MKIRATLIALLMLFFAVLGAEAVAAPTEAHIYVPRTSLANRVLHFPYASQDWDLKYVFVVPHAPYSFTWNPNTQTFYLWGDVDFDKYGAGQPFAISRYKYNQILPQLVIGDVLAANSWHYEPSWRTLDSWGIIAAYYWMDDNNVSYAQTGSLVHVNPGDTVTSLIHYSAATGKISVSISAPEGTSSIGIDRPFPNESKPLFKSWREFFEKAQEKSSYLYGHTGIEVETYNINENTLCSVLPFVVRKIVYPGDPEANETFWMGGPCDNDIR